MEYLAHITEDKTREQTVLEHLLGTAIRAAEFAETFGAMELGCLCGMLHDVGKYSEGFQKRIKQNGKKVDHSTAGALVAMKECGSPHAAFCISGHHGGLPDMGSKKQVSPNDNSFRDKMARQPGRDIEDFSAFRSELEIPRAHLPEFIKYDVEAEMFFIRMLFSCLVDADFLDTEYFMKQGKVERLIGEPLSSLNKKLDTYVEKWWSAKEGLNKKRCQILRALIDGAQSSPGLFTLSVPTGGGKTVASAAFALKHAIHNEQRRIIYVIPYCSIIEQTQKVFEDIFGRQNVVAHFANVEYKNDENSENEARYLAAENWDAPIILTTAVQFFESLFSNRTSSCRKLHNIAQSTIIFDEAQMLPVPYIRPCLWAIAQLIKNYGCSAVLCTATQPALGRILKEFLPGHESRELCPKELSEDEIFERVIYKNDGALSDEELSERLENENQVLCIVNTKRRAQKLYSNLAGEGGYHLSTAMYPAHRRMVLEEIKERLLKGLPCRVISTSLIEAGVDVSFPTVCRELAGLDSIIQAAGRCNREGKRRAQESIVHIFKGEGARLRAIDKNICSAEVVLEDYEDITSEEAIDEYFSFLLYRLKDERELDEKEIIRDIRSREMNFAKIAERFHIIENMECTVYIPLGNGKRLCDILEHAGPGKQLMREMGQYAVGVRRDTYLKLCHDGHVKPIGENAGILQSLNLYNNKTGLHLETEGGQANIV